MSNLHNNENTPLICDLLIIGGGINGVGVARDAAGRGLSVILCEKDDLASHTSSASSKLIHGGLRYLEYYEFGLVRKALIERERLLRIAPHLIKPLRIVMPHMKGLRPRWLLRVGLFLYDTLAPRAILPSSSSVEFKTSEAGVALKPIFTHGFEYSDAWVDDARLVVLNALDAAEHGASILTRTVCESMTQFDGHWLAQINTQGKIRFIKARCVVNASGAWASKFSEKVQGKTSNKLRLVKGSHIIVKKLFAHKEAYIFQHPDGRIVFTTPYEQDFTLIGTTDVEFKGDANDVKISSEEIKYLCDLSNQYFTHSISPEDVVWSYSGVRALADDGGNDAQSVTRDYKLEISKIGAPLLNVFGGKITTYRRLAEDVMTLICPLLGFNVPTWTANACLPGGDVNGATPNNEAVIEFDQFVQQCQNQYDWLSKRLISRYAHSYGTRIHQLLYSCQSLDDMGEEVVESLFAREVRYLIQKEFAVTAKDILWRRSKLGLHLPKDSEDKLENWMIHQSFDQ
jgi:glycerol-3-phosphate dehydrogenase